MPWTALLRLVAAVGAVVVAAACASSTGGPSPRPFPTPSARRGGVLPPGVPPANAPAASPREPTTSLPPAVRSAPVLAQAVVTRALDYVGAPYRLGGNDPSGFDCSGLTAFVFRAQGISLPRTVAEQFGVGRKIDLDEVRAGDLLFFATSGRGASHVAIALGDGSFVHAPNSRGGVRVEALNGRYWTTRLLGARRIIR